jgi:hypothetical protein
MKLLTNLIDNILQASWSRVQQAKEVAPSLRGLSVGSVEERPPTTMIRTFTLNEAMNGSYITFTRRKYNPNGPDEYRNEIYIVQPGETLVDAISTVLVLTEK